ncbi:MAG TPA: VTT domain-containing protein [Acidimicrobiales bacterium]|nr:VTT domain-containing protein [Acidimicrobiales bacterium]
MPRTATMIDLDALAGLGLLAYLLVFGFAAFDVVFPVLPSEATVILAGVLAWQGRLSIVAVGLAAAAGAIVGDHMSYGLGRWTSRGALRRPRGKVARLQAWAAQQLHVRGPTVLLVARFVPGGRTASTFMSGRLRLPLARFSAVTCVAGPLWAAFAASLGYIGGTTFHDHTLLATGLGIAVGLALAGLAELALRRLGIYRPPAPEVIATDDDLAA